MDKKTFTGPGLEPEIVAVPNVTVLRGLTDRVVFDTGRDVRHESYRSFQFNSIQFNFFSHHVAHMIFPLSVQQ